MLCGDSMGCPQDCSLRVEGGSETEDVGEADFLEGLLCHVRGIELNPEENEWETNEEF